MSLVLAAATVSGCIAAASGAAQAPAKAFPPGCWSGKGAVKGTFASGPTTAKITKGKFTFTLWVTKSKNAFGTMDASGHGEGRLTISGSKLDLEVSISGDLTLEGPSSTVTASGFYRWKGVAIGSGEFAGSFPVDFKMPVQKSPLQILTVSKTKIVGLFRKAKWTALPYHSAETKALCN